MSRTAAPNPITQLLASIAPRGVQFSVVGDQLRIKPGSGLTAGQRSEIATYKEGIVALARRVAGTDPVLAKDLWVAATAAPPPTDPEMVSWSEDARYIYHERLGVALDQGMDIAPGSEAETIARREARRAHAGIPADFGQSRTPDIFDAALEAFLPLGGVAFTHSEPRLPSTPSEDAGTPKHKDSIP